MPTGLKNYNLKFLKSVRAEYFFLYAAIFFEILLTIVTPPLQSPDELNHFYRAYQVSEGQFSPIKENHRLGGYMPYCFREFATAFEPVSGNEYYRISRKDLLEIFTIAFDPNKREFKDFPNTANYSVVSYFPQSLGIFVLRQFNVSVGALYYGGRYSIFLIWLLCMFFAIKILPVYKWLFTIFILLPMNIYLSNSFSADTVTNILSFLLIAVILMHVFSKNTINTKNLTIILLLAVLLVFAKILYATLILLLLIIPSGKFQSKKFRFSALFAVFLITFFTAYFWSETIMNYYLSYFDYNPLYRDSATVAHGTDYYVQKAYTIKHKAYIFEVIYNTLVRNPKFYLKSYIGGFGTYLHLFISGWICFLSYLFIILIVFLEERKNLFSVFQKLVLFFVALSCIILLIISQHLTWNPVGLIDMIDLQGRYFIPIFPMFFLLFNNSVLKIKYNPAILSMAFILLINLYACYFIYFSFVKEQYYKKTEFFCGLEETDGQGYFKTTNQNIKLEGAQSQTASQHRTGNYAVALTPGNPYALTYRFKNFDKRDLAEITAWQKGDGGVLAISGKGNTCGDFYFTDQNVCYEDKNGWKKMHMVFSMWKKCGGSEAGFYIYNPGKSTIYFDDISFSIKKFKEGALEPF